MRSLLRKDKNWANCYNSRCLKKNKTKEIEVKKHVKVKTNALEKIFEVRGDPFKLNNLTRWVSRAVFFEMAIWKNKAFLIEYSLQMLHPDSQNKSTCERNLVVKTLSDLFNSPSFLYFLTINFCPNLFIYNILIFHESYFGKWFPV